jgi:hypothetical protein
MRKVEFRIQNEAECPDVVSYNDFFQSAATAWKSVSSR